MPAKNSRTYDTGPRRTTGDFYDLHDFRSFDELRKRLAKDVDQMEAELGRWRTPAWPTDQDASESYFIKHSLSHKTRSTSSSTTVYEDGRDSSESGDSDLGMSETMSPVPPKGILKRRSTPSPMGTTRITEYRHSPKPKDTRVMDKERRPKDKLIFKFDVGDLRGADLAVQIMDTKLHVFAMDRKSDFRREVQLPRTADPDSALSTLSNDGILRVEVILLS
ncbi:hypothetical protein BV898_10301 [Hypsibius exemplaris]|uniref:SHSP domain-containing protein n=1 Tax=Hypsibius exemplaris TaxID=2072580 RepID=A0A1W0WK33_HYPEX|nr:hypothetical protein BV898_10301 [Hypsibius exemplaris]